jgi:hypothetical protein
MRFTRISSWFERWRRVLTVYARMKRAATVINLSWPGKANPLREIIFTSVY